MSALAEALVAAQRRALAALEKAYVAGQLDPPEDDPLALTAEGVLTARLRGLGITDPIDVAFLCASLDVLREWGVTAPTMSERVARENGEPKKATEGQVSYITGLLTKGNHEALFEDDLRALTFDRASQLIDALKAGSYNPAEWELPF